MKLRNKLLFPTLLVIFLGFSSFVALEISIQNRKADVKMKTSIEKLTTLIVTANTSYVWNYDTIGLQQSLDSFAQNDEIVGIEIFDADGKSMCKVAEDGETGTVQKEADMMRDGTNTGKASISFTDKYIRAETRSIINGIILIELAIFFIVGIMICLISRVITRPVINLTGIMRDMAEGEANLALRMPETGNDEMAKLSLFFNTFLDKLKVIVVSLKNVSVESRALGNDLAKSSQAVSSSSSQMAVSTGLMNESVNVLASEITGSGENVTRINEFIARVVDKIQEQANDVNESSAAIEQMIANVAAIERSTESKLSIVRGLESRAKRLEEGAAMNVQAMEETSQSTDLISEMITVINTVASQTNLLAMNAAIEAAHAGEFGKGFSIVADEIRKLAEQTAENSKNISDTIARVVEGIGKATGMTKDSSLVIGEVIEGIKNVADGMGETLDGLKEISVGNTQITESLGELNRITEDVRNSGVEMKAGTEQIDVSMRKIARVIEGNKREITDLSAGIAEISKSIAELTDHSNRNSSNIKTLDDEISKFKT